MDNSSSTLPISVVILTKNEQRNLGECLDSVRDLEDVYVVDSGSCDATVQIATHHDRPVVQFKWDGRYPKKKQWALDNVATKYDWVLCLDADERLSGELYTELEGLSCAFLRDTYGAFDVPVEYHFGGRRLRFGHRVSKRALVHKRRFRFPVIDDLEVADMEVEGHYQPVGYGRVGRLTARLRHSDEDSVASWFERHNRYSSWEATIAESGNIDVGLSRSRNGKIFARTPLKPAVFFIYSYVVRLGVADGRAGFDYAWALTNYYWQIGVKRRELRRVKRLDEAHQDRCESV